MDPDKHGWNQGRHGGRGAQRAGRGQMDCFVALLVAMTKGPHRKGCVTNQ